VFWNKADFWYRFSYFIGETQSMEGFLMPKKRKTKEELNQEHYEADRRVWAQFERKLSAAQTYGDAIAIAYDPNSLGHKYHAHLSFFLQEWRTPGGSNSDELSLYIQLVRRLESAGEPLKPGAPEIIIAALQKSMVGRPRYV
jgi:hypothetical protein